MQNVLQQCEQEQLALSGAIQAHGCLLVLNSEHLITHVSENVPLFLGGELADWLNKYLPQNMMGLIDLFQFNQGRRLSLPAGYVGQELFDVILSRGAGHGLNLEFYRHQPVRIAQNNVSFSDSDLENSLEQQLLENVAAWTRFQRVMFYKFHESGDGEVTHEVRDGEVYGSYLGLRFPASDIPQIARELYLKNHWRFIADASEDSVDILSSASAKHPDLTYVDLRSVSPVHRTYLANMQVRSSLSFPMILGERLYGLVACHHSQPQPISLSLLERVSEIVRHHNILISSHITRERMRLIDNLNRRFNSVANRLRECDICECWQEISLRLFDEFKVDGAICILDESYLSFGEVFEGESLSYFDEWFIAKTNQVVWHSDCLTRDVPMLPISHIAGLMAFKLNLSNGRLLRMYLTRTEHIYEVAWGGNPQKPVEILSGNLTISPRRSFEKWLEKRIGFSRPWNRTDFLLLLKLRELFTTLYE